MKFFKQLWLLIWKNLSLRRRQMLRNVVELLWPLAIFLILSMVRKRRPAEHKPQLFFKPRALPSAGVLPFLQSFICDYSNPTTPYQYGLPDYSNTSFYKLAEDLQPLLQNRSNLEVLSRIQNDYSALMRSLNDLQLINISQVNSGATLNNILINTSAVRDFIRQYTTFNETYVNAMLNSTINVTQVLRVYEDLQGRFSGGLSGASLTEILNLASTWNTEVCGEPGFKSFFILPENIDGNYLQDQMCKLTTSEWIQLGNSIISSIDWQALNRTFRDTNVFDIYMKWRYNITDEAQRLIQDVQALQSLGPVLRDLQFASSAVPSVGNMTSNSTVQQAFQMRRLLCGDTLQAQTNVLNTASSAFGNAAASGDSSSSSGASSSSSSSSSSQSSKPVEKGKCHNPPAKERIQCGQPGIAKGSCLAMGCCFNKVPDRKKSCYCKPGNEKCCRTFNRMVNFLGANNWRFTTLFTLVLGGKIFYTPDTPQTRRVVSQANTFISQIESGVRSVGQLKGPLENLLNFTKTYENDTDIYNQMETLGFFTSFGGILGTGLTNQIRTLSNQTETILKELVRNRNQIQMAYDVISLLVDVLDCYNISDFFQPFPSEEALVKRATDQAPGKPLFLSSIVFLNFHAKDGSFPKKAEYKLRLNPDFTPSTQYVRSRYWRPGPSFNGYYGAWTKFYINFGFVFLQDMIDRAFTEIITNRTILEPGVYTQQFPYPCYIRDVFTNVISNTLPLFMVLAWVYSSAMIIKSIVLEKELRLKEVMKVMGLSNGVHWTAWFITSLLFMTISVFLLAVLAKAGQILTNSNPVIVFWMLTSFAIATISMSFFISVFFSKANISAACGGIIYFFTYLPYSLTVWFEDQMTYSYKILANLFSTTGFGMACRYISRWEEQGVGAQWDNYYKSPLPGDEYSLGTCVNMMLLDAFIYLLLMWYLENIMPGEYGIPRKWYFPFTKSYWCGRTKRRCFREHRISQSGFSDIQLEMPSIGGGRNGTPVQNESNFEPEPALRVGVQIQNLVKIYKRGRKLAVDSLNLKLFEGQITSLLGHNGAGKSTTMSVLTGLLPPTRGTALIYGNDIRTDIDEIRKGLGLCPQHNVLFNHLTVEEHMWFFAQLKGMPKSDIKSEINKFLEDVGLTNKKGEISMNLSGGMKRKLSVALAFIANSRTVILDEPTAGVDPYSRRCIWDLILKYKKGRTILLSTHYMDEADLLGDRISIISHGKLCCSGAPLFLKRRYGDGYYLTVAKDTTRSSEFNQDEISDLVHSHVPGSYLKENTESELCYVLPSETRQLGSFKMLFKELETSASNLCIKTYGLSDTSIEEVFLKVTEKDERSFEDDDKFQDENDDEKDNISLTGPVQRRQSFAADSQSLHSYSSTKGLLQSDMREMNGISATAYRHTKTGPALWAQQFIALLIKRFHHARRGKRGFLSQILLPAIFVAAAMAFSLLRPPRGVLPSLKLSPSQYGVPNYVFIANLRKNFSLTKKVVDAAVKGPGLGAECTKPTPCSRSSNPYPFVLEHMMWNFSAKFKNFPSCSCSSGKQQCPSGAYGPRPPMRTLNTKDTVIDLTGRNISEYLLKSTDEFVKRRYGGLSIGDMAKYYPELSYQSQNNSGPVQNVGFSTSGVQTNAKVWFNNKGYHSAPTYLNVLNNAILRANLPPGSDPSEYGIVTYNHPMDFNREQLGEETLMQGFTDLLVAIFVIIALSFVPSSFLVYLVDDRSSKSKHLQLVSGLHPFIYWLGNYIWDLVNYLLPAICCILVFLVFDQESYVSSVNFPATFLLLFLYGWSMTPLMYPASFIFNVPSTAYIVMICINLFVGVIGTLSTFILELFPDDPELSAINSKLKVIFLIFPNYCLGRGLMDLARNQFTAKVYSVFMEYKLKDPFQWDIVGRNLFAMFLCGIAYFAITVLIQYRFFIKARTVKQPGIPLDPNMDEDVLEEKKRVKSEESKQSDVLRVTDLTKIYRSFLRRKKLLAVNRLSFGVRSSECFGLLGVNGAGKTTTFKMLTGDTHATSGNAFIGKSSILSDINDARKQLGYCPQFDALDGLLTAREMLSYYARLRGIRWKDTPQIAEWGISKLDLLLYADRICGDYSGGNKRKLSTAIAFIADPNLIFLDEPTTGMDPGARRFLWDVINSVVREHKSVVLTSHSMEECEALCTRLGIMVNGKFLCFGSPQQLRSKYGQNYTIGIRAKLEELESVRNFMTANFPTSSLKDQHHNMLEYAIPSQGLLLSEVFCKLEILRATNTIFDYSVTQTTLDQIFVRFARQQTEGVELDGDEPEMLPDSQLQSFA